MNETAQLHKDKEISEDMHKTNENNIESMIKTSNSEVDALVSAKADDVMHM